MNQLKATKDKGSMFLRRYQAFIMRARSKLSVAPVREVASWAAFSAAAWPAVYASQLPHAGGSGMAAVFVKWSMLFVTYRSLLVDVQFMYAGNSVGDAQFIMCTQQQNKSKMNRPNRIRECCFYKALGERCCQRFCKAFWVVVADFTQTFKHC